MCLWAANQRRYWRMRDVNIAQLFQKHDLPTDVKDMIFSLSEVSDNGKARALRILEAHSKKPSTSALLHMNSRLHSMLAAQSRNPS